MIAGPKIRLKLKAGVNLGNARFLNPLHLGARAARPLEIECSFRSKQPSRLARGHRVDEIQQIMSKYDERYSRDGLASAADVTKFAATFYKDVAEIFDVVTRVKNGERNPTGFTLADAPILGLLVRIWKLLKEILRYYDENNAEMIGVLDRPLLEAAVMAAYLMKSNEAVMEDYRKCSYRHRLRMVLSAKAGSPFFETKAGKRLLNSIKEKMAFEKLTEEDFALQKKNRWHVQNKTFYDIFHTLHDEDLYAVSYGIMSESIHGSWNDSMDFCLTKNDDGTFSAFPFLQPADIRYVSPLLMFSVPAYRAWLQRIQAYDDGLRQVLDWVERVNSAIFKKFDAEFDGP